MAGPDLDNLDPDFLRDVRALLAACEAHAATYKIISGYRSLDEQAALYRAYKAGGPRAAAPGTSAHNFGLAVDVARMVDGKADWLPGDYATLADLAPRYGLETLAALKDFGHVQRIGWEALKP